MSKQTKTFRLIVIDEGSILGHILGQQMQKLDIHLFPYNRLLL